MALLESVVMAQPGRRAQLQFCLAEMNFSVQFPDGTVKEYKVDPGVTTLLQLKRMLAVDSKIAVESQVLNGREPLIYDGGLLPDLGVRPKDVLVLTAKPPRVAGAGHQIFVKTLTGKQLVLDVSPQTTVLEAKQEIQRLEGIPPDQQRVIFSGKHLSDNGSLLADAGVKREDTVHLVLRLKGGPWTFNLFATWLCVLTAFIVSREPGRAGEISANGKMIQLSQGLERLKRIAS